MNLKYIGNMNLDSQDRQKMICNRHVWEEMTSCTYMYLLSEYRKDKIAANSYIWIDKRLSVIDTFEEKWINLSLRIFTQVHGTIENEKIR